MCSAIAINLYGLHPQQRHNTNTTFDILFSPSLALGGDMCTLILLISNTKNINCGTHPSFQILLTFFSSILVECVVAWMHGVGTSILYCLMFDLVISVVFTQDYLMFLEQ